MSKNMRGLAGEGEAILANCPAVCAIVYRASLRADIGQKWSKTTNWNFIDEFPCSPVSSGNNITLWGRSPQIRTVYHVPTSEHWIFQASAASILTWYPLRTCPMMILRHSGRAPKPFVHPLDGMSHHEMSAHDTQNLKLLFWSISPP